MISEQLAELVGAEPGAGDAEPLAALAQGPLERRRRPVRGPGDEDGSERHGRPEIQK